MSYLSRRVREDARWSEMRGQINRAYAEVLADTIERRWPVTDLLRAQQRRSIEAATVNYRGRAG
jgi:hypothetical protein